ncbi:hypothetical protein ACN75_30035 [Escherichia coli]|nr:hypothetical protein ACN75_30035 [Escherichia coli]
MSEQITFATSDFASNPEPRCPCILLLDVSGSMSGRPINELNAGCKRLARTVLIFTERSDQLSRATDHQGEGETSP